MRSLCAALLIVAACSSSEATEPAPAQDAGREASSLPSATDAGIATRRDASVPDASDASPVDAGPLDPLCDGDKLRARCAELLLPAEYGVGQDCDGTPYRGTVRRAGGLVGCVDWETLATGERLTCCPE